MNTDESVHNSEITPERFAEWLRQREQPPEGATDAATLTWYLAGALSPESARALEGRLVRDGLVRSRLREVRRCLDELQTLTWAAVEARLQQSGAASEVAEAWLSLLNERLATATRVPEWRRANPWEQIREHLGRGVAEAQAAWTAMFAFGHQLQVAIAQPRLALARGEAQPTVTGLIPPGVDVIVTEASVTDDGALRVLVELRDADGHPSPALDQQPIHLSLVAAGEAWHVLSGIVREARAKWEAPGLGAALGLSAGAVPSRHLHLTVGRLTPEAHVGGLPVLAEVVEAAGHAPAPPVILEFVSTPRWEDETFIVTVAISPEARAAFPDHELRLELVVAPHCHQYLGAWRVGDWTEDQRILTARCPGSPPAAMPMASIVRPRLHAPAAA